MATDATIDSLPTMEKGQRGGPRYVLVRAGSTGHGVRCSDCNKVLMTGELHAYDRVRRFGSAPRRYCRDCWAREPKAQVNR
jgi:hypothetical protein